MKYFLTLKQCRNCNRGNKTAEYFNLFTTAQTACALMCMQSEELTALIKWPNCTSQGQQSTSRRSPVAVGRNAFDIVDINYHVIYEKVNMDCITRRQFVLMLVHLLVCKQPIESYDDTQLRENNKAD